MSSTGSLVEVYWTSLLACRLNRSSRLLVHPVYTEALLHIILLGVGWSFGGHALVVFKFVLANPFFAPITCRLSELRRAKVEPEGLPLVFPPFPQSECKNHCFTLVFYWMLILLKARLSTVLHPIKNPALSGILTFFRGAGGNRTLVQTGKRQGFYMLICKLVFVAVPVCNLQFCA